jgi:cytochrome c
MNKKRNIIIGLLILVLIVLSPVLYSLATGGNKPAPELELPVGETQCIEGKDFMNAHHMTLLDDWRDRVVREGQQMYTSAAYGKEHVMSLTRTCMNCHTKKSAFCDRCHDYTGVNPYCWDCHINPEDQ